MLPLDIGPLSSFRLVLYERTHSAQRRVFRAATLEPKLGHHAGQSFHEDYS
jgi:hypothetical protein